MQTSHAQALLPLHVRLAVENRQGWSRVPAETLQPGNVLVVLPGDRMPVDGIVVEGCRSLDESALTGEAIPVVKSPGLFTDTVHKRCPRPGQFVLMQRKFEHTTGLEEFFASSSS